MRPLLVLALCSCNQLYDLDATKVRDAGITDAGDRAVRLAAVLGSAASANESALVYQPLPDARIKLALLDDTLRDVTYTPTADGGLVDYPFSFGDRRWRLEYNPPFDVAHEVQWDPSAGVGFVTAPVAGRLARATAPANTGYTLSMKVGGTTLYTFSDQTVIYTTGYWSATRSPFSTNTPTIDFAASTSLEGPVSAPVPGDIVVAVDYRLESGSNCTQAVISGGASAPALDPGVMKPVELVSHLMTELPIIEYLGEGPVLAPSRLASALGDLGGATAGRLRFGRIPHTQLPAFTTSFDDTPSPPLVTIFDCPTLGRPNTNSNDIGGSLGFARVFHGAITNDRTVGGVRLRSSLTFLGRGFGTIYLATLEVPLATDIRIGSSLLTVDDAPIPASARDLSFTFDRAAPYLADYYEVTLYRIENAKLVPVRVYVGLDVTAARPTIRIDPSLVTPGISHVFAIRTYRGRPRAPIGDFRVVDYFQAAGTIFTHTFRR